MSRALREPARIDLPSTQAERLEERIGKRERVPDPGDPSLGLLYRIVERAPRGADRIVGMGGTLDARRTIDLMVEVEQPGYLYVVAETGSGRRAVLHPETARTQPAAPARNQAIVRTGEVTRLSLDAVLESARGQGSVRVLVLLARQPVEKRGTDLADEVVHAVRRTGDASTLMIERRGPQRDATSVINRSDAPAAMLAVTLAFDPVP